MRNLKWWLGSWGLILLVWGLITLFSHYDHLDWLGYAAMYSVLAWLMSGLGQMMYRDIKSDIQYGKKYRENEKAEIRRKNISVIKS